MESSVKVDAGPVVVPKVPPIPDTWVCQRLVFGMWLTEKVVTERIGRDMCEREGTPYRIVRIPGEEVKHGG
jgi:hypothetical protein